MGEQEKRREELGNLGLSGHTRGILDMTCRKTLFLITLPSIQDPAPLLGVRVDMCERELRGMRSSVRVQCVRRMEK